MKRSVCLLELKKIDTKGKLHGLWVTLRIDNGDFGLKSCVLTFLLISL